MGGCTGKFVEKKFTLDKNILPAKYFHKMLYHQTTTNQTKINELKIMLCYNYNYELMRPSKGIINLANLRTMVIYLSKLNLLQMQKVQFNWFHAQQPCTTLTRLICTAVFSALLICHHRISASNCSKYCN